MTVTAVTPYGPKPTGGVTIVEIGGWRNRNRSSWS
jgi:hypothetical protein